MRPTYHWYLSTSKESKLRDQILQVYPEVSILAAYQRNQCDEEIIATADCYSNYPKIIIMNSFEANLELRSWTCLFKFKLKLYEYNL